MPKTQKFSPPPVIFLQPDSDDEWEGVTWCVDQIHDTDVKYIRLDMAVLYDGEEE